ncbi:hypothetical protein SynMVIR181_02044 [Synechococcus sp. MVIR-18-1]|nr:hypothetical protein SynMVIR181_02044 [Synechococcus sp. MVIR-18-1]
MDRKRVEHKQKKRGDYFQSSWGKAVELREQLPTSTTEITTKDD